MSEDQKKSMIKRLTVKEIIEELMQYPQDLEVRYSYVKCGCGNNIAHATASALRYHEVRGEKFVTLYDLDNEKIPEWIFRFPKNFQKNIENIKNNDASRTHTKLYKLRKLKQKLLKTEHHILERRLTQMKGKYLSESELEEFCKILTHFFAHREKLKKEIIEANNAHL